MIPYKEKYDINKLPIYEAQFVDNENIYWNTPPGKPESHHILEISLNKVDFLPIMPKHLPYSYTYYEDPHVESINPSFGPVKPEVERILIIKGRNFNFPENF